VKSTREVGFKLANAPTSWGIEAPLKPTYPPWTKVLREASTAGYEGIELGPYGFFPVAPETLATALAQHRLKLVAGTVMEPFDVVHERPRIRALTEKTAALLASQSAEFVVIIFGMSPAREASAGRSEDAVRLSDAEFATSLDTISAIADIAHDHGLVPVLHPHAGTHLEFRDEIDRLAIELPGIRFCVDTGHAAYAGIDASELIDSLGERVAYVHLKDVDSRVLNAARRQRLGFWRAYEKGIFTILGAGLVDFRSVLDVLDGSRYDGWLTVEQDEMPGRSATPLENAVASRQFVASIRDPIAR
jgi:inosose dehydratase